MILIDTSVWVAHLQAPDLTLTMLLERQRVVMHPLVLGELAMSKLKQRSALLDLLRDLPEAVVARDDEVLGFVERFKIHGRGIGFIDAHLLASAKLTAATRFWTRDQRLKSIAWALGIGAALS